MYAWALEYGYQGQVVTVDEMTAVRRVGGGAAGEELRGAAEDIIVRAAQFLVGIGCMSGVSVCRGSGCTGGGVDRLGESSDASFFFFPPQRTNKHHDHLLALA